MKRFYLLLALLLALMAGCDLLFGPGDVDDVDTPVPTTIAEEPGATATRPSITPAPGATDTRPAATRVKDKWNLWVSGTHLRGVDMHPCVLFTVDGCVQPTTRQDIQDLRDLGANLINASYPGVFAEEAPYGVNPTTLAYLDDLVEWAEDVGLYVAIHFRTGPGRNEGAITSEGKPLFDVWRDQAAHDAWVEMWRFTAERYRDAAVVVGYNLMVEPHPNTLVDPRGKLEPLEAQSRAQGTLMDWNAFAAEITAAIREVDPDTPIIVNSISWASAEWFSALEPTGDPHTVYSLHAYDPDVYILQEEGESTIRYPSIVDDYGEKITFDRGWLEENYRPVREFARQHNVPIYVGEFGVLRWVPDAVTFVRDQTELFEQYGWNYAVYVWRGDESNFDGFNLELGPDPENHTPVPDNPLLGVFLDRWAQNVNFPGSPVPDRAGLPPLGDVSHWLYLIDVDLEPETVEQIVSSTYDMAVLDFIPSEANNTDYPMADVVARLHGAVHPKLVIAYIDIGQAEDYRTYWQPGWRIGNPEWIVAGDPDGWEGNYPVAYWQDQYRDVWLGSEGYLQAILDAGFDGVYLDWVEAYSDENVMAFAKRQGIDPLQEMIRWVGDIADFGRAQNPDFIVIAQNAAELAAHDEYVHIIDAIAQEQVWFDGGADNDPPGDCPLPRTDADVDAKAYRESLSPVCRRTYDRYPDSTLHVSSEEYLRYLALAQQKGLPIFTVDYALEPENVAWVYETSRALGFVPFVSNRGLDRYINPMP
jgi:cysteinyl-tRNA synthetase